MSDPLPASDLPRPFYQLPWTGAQRKAAHALWHFHTALTDPRAPRLDGDDLTAYFEAERAHAAAGDPLKVVPEAVGAAAYAACETHGLPRERLARQVRAARLFKRPRVRFRTPQALDAFLQEWIQPHAMLLAELGGAGHAWQERPLFELARGFFLTDRLVRLPEDLEHDCLFFAEVDLEQYGVAVEDLREGPPPDGTPPEYVQRLLWKQAVRARDALAQAQEALVKELSRRQAWALRCYWLGAVDVLDRLERRGYDVWTQPSPGFPWWRRPQIFLQAFLGRTGR